MEAPQPLFPPPPPPLGEHMVERLLAGGAGAAALALGFGRMLRVMERKEVREQRAQRRGTMRPCSSRRSTLHTVCCCSVCGRRAHLLRPRPR
jgi:hypothetical protein